MYERERPRAETETETGRQKERGRETDRDIDRDGDIGYERFNTEKIHSAPDHSSLVFSTCLKLQTLIIIIIILLFIDNCFKTDLVTY